MGLSTGDYFKIGVVAVFILIVMFMYYKQKLQEIDNLNMKLVMAEDKL